MMQHQPVCAEWQQASLYGMLAGHYEYSDRERHLYYAGLQAQSLSRLASLVALYGDPFSGGAQLTRQHRCSAAGSAAALSSKGRLWAARS